MAGDYARGGDGYSKPSEYYPVDKKHGNYQFINLGDIINNFTATYVGEGKILQNVLGGDVNYHAHRAFQELSYDLFKSHKTQEITLPPSLQMILPHDYVNYTKITWSDSNGIEHIIYPTNKTSNANTIQQDEDGNYMYAKADQGNSEGMAKMLQDSTVKMAAMGYKLRKNYGISYSTNKLEEDYSGPFYLDASYARYSQNDAGTVEIDSQALTEPVLKDGMQILHIGMQPNTTITNVSIVDDPSGGTNADGSLKKATEFYIDKATYSDQPNSQPNSIRMVYFQDITGDTTWGKYKGASGTTVGVTNTLDPGTDNSHYFTNTGERYGLDPQFAQSNGSYFIDQTTGKIHFSSGLSGKTIILHYLSDSVGGTKEMLVHKLAEEAVYKWILYACASARIDIPENIIQRLKRERSAEVRRAKLRLSNIKLEELTQILRGKSKWIKH